MADLDIRTLRVLRGSRRRPELHPRRRAAVRRPAGDQPRHPEARGAARDDALRPDDAAGVAHPRRGAAARRGARAARRPRPDPRRPRARHETRLRRPDERGPPDRSAVPPGVADRCSGPRVPQPLRRCDGRVDAAARSGRSRRGPRAGGVAWTTTLEGDPDATDSVRATRAHPAGAPSVCRAQGCAGRGHVGHRDRRKPGHAGGNRMAGHRRTVPRLRRRELPRRPTKPRSARTTRRIISSARACRS